MAGFSKAWKIKSLSSEIDFEGLIKKVMIIDLGVMASMCQQLIGDLVPIWEIVILFFITN